MAKKRKPQVRVRRKREQERAERKRRERMRKVRAWATVAAVVALALTLFFVFSGGKKVPTAAKSGTPTPSVSPTPTTPPTAAACGGPLPGAYKGKTYTAYPKNVIDQNKKYLVTMSTSCGIVKMTLDPKLAPKAVNNFVFLAQQGFYDNTKIHRITNNPNADAIFQGGDPKGDGTGGPGYKFVIEKPPSGTKYLAGTIAMANSGGTDTNGSQFFVVVHDWASLPGDYTIMGNADLATSKPVLEKIVALPGTPLQGGLGTGPSPPLYIYKVTVTAV